MCAVQVHNVGMTQPSEIQQLAQISATSLGVQRVVMHHLEQALSVFVISPSFDALTLIATVSGSFSFLSVQFAT